MTSLSAQLPGLSVGLSVCSAVAAKLLAGAFQDDPMYRCVIPDDRKRAKDLLWLFGKVVPIPPFSQMKGYGSVKEYRNPPNVHPPIAAYTHQIEIRRAERLLILSGQIGRKEDGTVPDDPIEQLEVAWENLHRNLRAANMDVDDIVKLTFYLVGEMDVERRRDVIASRLKGHKPCMTLIFVASLASPVYKVELDAWASSAE
jgi:2-iminobutanoate/2-iminopropanoate deaminase